MENLIGFILPVGIDFINKHITDSKVRYLIALAVCLLIGMIFHISELKAGSVNEFLTTSGIIFTEAQTVYKLYWEKSSIREKMTG